MHHGGDDHAACDGCDTNGGSGQDTGGWPEPLPDVGTHVDEPWPQPIPDVGTHGALDEPWGSQPDVGTHGALDEPWGSQPDVGTWEPVAQP